METTLKLLPVCECGYVIRDLEIDQTETWCGFNYYVPFNPGVCPNCHKFIKSMSIDGRFLEAFYTRKKDKVNE